MVQKKYETMYQKKLGPNTLNAINWIFEDTFNGSMAMKNSKEKVALQSL